MGIENRPKLQRAFILNRRPYRETSLLVEAFTAQSGRIGLVAKGAKRGKAPLAAILQPFRPLLLSWRGSGELFTLTQAEPDDALSPPSISPVKSGFYLNELLLRLLPRHDPHVDLFQDYSHTLTKIPIPDQEEPALRIFEKRLLRAIGYGLALDRDAETGRPVESHRVYRYRQRLGFIEYRGASNTITTVHGSTLIAMDRESLHEPEQLREAKSLMRAILRGYLGEKPLASRMLYRRATAG
uniref:DNA repair protein RecO n=1 Tax=Candidatus Kentrum sp. MB TaxID=2138164 RepID=A0A450XVT6_9GAMM|nr:MAG: DNA replication and repair protein RecO [Candidatus Kentron sp. MB]VFK35936.1 MAG: DNA replication and repair protein RecO [Candidatus Kentron sp. MB]VFK77569.1 MAG: DNA replication and repair protein RecO [Candidatus Kentron sp. MB]